MSALYGIIGYPLSHSFSPAYFNEKFAREKIDAQYKAFELPDIHYFGEILKNHPNLKGLNITLPHKQTIIDQLDALSAEAAEIGAVNCIDIRDGILKGYNTDAIGFERSFSPLLKEQHKKALVLGTGGAAQAVKYVLEKLNITYLNVSRKKSAATITYEEIDGKLLEEYTIIINTTPLGMYPHVKQTPDIPFVLICRNHLLYDLVYNPEETRFLSLGKAQKATVTNGMEMLELQAEVSWEIWNS